MMCYTHRASKHKVHSRPDGVSAGGAGGYHAIVRPASLVLDGNDSGGRVGDERGDQER